MTLRAVREKMACPQFAVRLRTGPWSGRASAGRCRLTGTPKRFGTSFSSKPRLHAFRDGEDMSGVERSSVVAGLKGEPAEGGQRVLDIRGVSPAERHPRIFGTFTNLEFGESFVLVNDHDPKPLFYQFQAEYTGQFSWEYLEQGPKTWRVRIGKQGSAVDRTPLHTIP